MGIELDYRIGYASLTGNSLPGETRGIRHKRFATVHISTTQPICTYYFGPFQHQNEAVKHHAGYVEDLTAEGAQNIQVAIKQCKPQCLTTCDE